MYELTPAMKARLDSDYTYHKPINDQQDRYETIRNAAKYLATTIVQCSPVSREQSVALTDLEKVVMMANAAIARNEKESVNESVTT